MEPNHGGSIPSAERGEAARELIWTANSALVERLLFIMNDKDDPGLSATDNKRRRYARILWAMATYFDKLGHDKLPALGRYIGGLGVALEDLIDGVTDPLFVTKGSKRDSMRTWGARLQAALGLECLILSDLPREKAASHAARHYEALASLKRGTKRDLKGSLLSWYDRYIEGRVPVPALQKAFQRRAAQSRRPTSRRRNTEDGASKPSRRPSNRQSGKFQPNPYFWFTRRSAYAGQAPTWRQPTRGFRCDTTRTRIGASRSASRMICGRCWPQRRGGRCARCALKSSSGCGRRSSGTKTWRRHDNRP
jgi:hypothetical protein